jgi:hypothetical protein
MYLFRSVEDAMEWVWQQDLTDSRNSLLCLNMDEAAFFNDGGAESMCNIERKELSSLDFYASEDIQIGEEILYDYSGLVFDPNEMDL